MNEVVAQLADRLGYPQVEIFLVEGTSLVQRAYRGVHPSVEAIPITQGVVGRVARTGDAAFVLDVTHEPDYVACMDHTISELAVPIYHDRVVVGVINIETNIPGQITDQDRDLLQVLAGQISIALENSVLYERVRRHAGDLEQIVEQRTAELVELYELSQKIGYTLSYNDLLRLLLSHLRKALDSDLVAGCLFTGGARLVSVETNRPISPGSLNALQTVWLDALQYNGLVVDRVDDLSIDVVSSNSYRVSDPPIEKVASILQVPLVVDGVVAGVLIAGSESENAFTPDRARILDTFANQAAVALQRLTAMLAAEQKRLESLVEHLPVGVLLLDGEYKLLLANPLGKELLILLNDTQGDGRLQHLGSLPVKSLVEHPTGYLPVDIALNTTPARIVEAQARPVGKGEDRWVITLREVTQERESRARIYTQERLATVGQLAAGIAHDFNNIMAAILVYADLLIDDPALPPVSRERLGIIQQQVERAASLIRQILDFSRRSVMEQSALDLLPFIKEMDKMLRRVMPETIQIELAYTPGEYVVNADPTRLQQALMNLALNARDAMPSGGLLRFGIRKMNLAPEDAPRFKDMPAGEWICLYVQDSGTGIAPENLAHMFEPFFTTKPVGQGTGLGLAQVYGIIKQHDGFIDVQSEPGKGALFTICLPAKNAPGKVDRGAVTPVHFDGTGKSVLIVEDDPATRTALEALLEAHNYRVLAASNGVEAMQILELESGSIEMVVSDIVMPRMGGVALYHVIHERWPRLKMLFITGHPLQGESQALLEKGIVHWLQKPFSVHDFRQAVFNLLQEQPG